VIPIAPIRKILRQQFSHHISQEAIVRVKDFVEDILIEFAKEIDEEFKRYNNLRIKQGLRCKKRIPVWLVNKVSNKFLNMNGTVYVGSQSSEVVNPDGEK